MLDYSLLIEYEFLRINFCSIEIVILLDWISLLFIRFVLLISSMVIYYRNEYIEGDFNINRFIILVFMFVLSMIFIILRPNLIRILLGWDGLGLVSYCLVIYYQNIKSNNAGIITALTNRIGDVMLLLSIAWILNYGSWNFLFYLNYFFNDFFITIIGLIVIIARITKRAQIPFSSWLPAAIAAPTPVSSLVHSSTLVTAGVYLLIRFYGGLHEYLLIFLLFIGVITIFIAGLGANYEFDLKKIIALSTLSQLGLIIRILALGELNLCFFHLLTHALFKATLFICAGRIIHLLLDNQDIRIIGTIIIQIPLTCIIFNISNLSLCGFPFLAGFYSKDLILEFISINYLNIYIYIIYFISTGLTMIYTIRLIYYTMIGSFNFKSFNYLCDEGFIMLKRIIFLVFIINVGGRLLIWIIMKIPYFICLPFVMKLMAIIFIIAGLLLGYELSNFKINYNLKFFVIKKLNYINSGIWNIPILSTFLFNKSILILRNLFYKNIDQGWLEYYGSQNLYNNYINISKFYQLIFNNNLKIYLLIFLVLIIILLILYLNSLKRVWFWSNQGDYLIFKYL